MTEMEWLSCTDPSSMLWSLRPQPTARKQRLFAVACCRRIWHLLSDDRCRQAVEVAELLADGKASIEEWNTVMLPVARIGWDELGYEAVDYLAAATSTAGWGYDADIPAGLVAAACEQPEDEGTAQASLLRDIFCNPFRPVSINPNWLTSPVINLATAAYSNHALTSGELDNAQLAILADALEDAGCDNQDILGHLRSPGPHFRGCHVLDLLLGRN